MDEFDDYTLFQLRLVRFLDRHGPVPLGLIQQYFDRPYGALQKQLTRGRFSELVERIHYRHQGYPRAYQLSEKGQEVALRLRKVHLPGGRR